jgi:hypothetical protein
VVVVVAAGVQFGLLLYELVERVLCLFLNFDDRYDLGLSAGPGYVS